MTDTSSKIAEGKTAGDAKSGRSSDRLRRQEAIAEGQGREENLYADAVAAFSRSEEFQRLVAGRTRDDAIALLTNSRQDILGAVESDRAAFREAVVEHWESGWRYGRALQGLAFVLGLVTLFLSGLAFIYLANGQDLALIALGVVGVMTGLVRAPLETRIAEFADANAARRLDRIDLQAAEVLLMRALHEVAFPQWLRQPEQPSDSASRDIASRVVLTGDASITPIEPFDRQHLVEVYRSSEQVSTRARVRLLKLVQSLTGASLGIAGPRGAGKTTLLRWLFDYTSSEFGHLTLRVPAPVRYEPRDFVLTVFAQLCEETMRSRGAPLLPGRQRMLGTVGAIWIGIALIVVGVAVNLSDATVPGTTRDFVGVGIAVAGVMVLMLRALTISGKTLSPEYISGVRIRSANPIDIAPTLLRDIRFQLTYATGYSGKLTAGVGELGADASYSLAARQESFPDVVARFQAFLEAVARQRDRVYIGIDELDKLPVDDAVRFLDDVKGLFGVPQCFFLVSISEDALGHFERRGMPMRDAFDSAFDEVVRVEPLPVAESVILLQRRAGGIHSGLANLCHVLAAGIPRDVIRQARRLAEIAEDRPVLAVAASALIDQDLQERVSGFKLSQDRDAARDRLLQSWIAGFDRTDVGVLLGRARSCPVIATRLGCLAYVGATALQLIAKDSDGSLSELSDVADELGEARLQVAMSPEIAWLRCDEVRRRAGLDVLHYPADAGGLVAKPDDASEPATA